MIAIQRNAPGVTVPGASIDGRKARHRPSSGTDLEAITAAEFKLFSTLQAKLALLGWACNECTEGGLIVTRWNRARRFHDLAELESFLYMVKGGH